MVNTGIVADNMTGHQQVALFFLISTAIAASLGDAITTWKGMDVGLAEGNPVARWLQKKVGKALAAVIPIVGVIFSACALSVYSAWGSIAYAAGITGLETFNTVRNYKLYLGAIQKVPKSVVAPKVVFKKVV